MTKPNLGLGLYLNPMNGEEYVKPLSLTLTVLIYYLFSKVPKYSFNQRLNF